MRPDIADGFRARAGDRYAGGARQGARRRHAGGRFHQLSRGGDRNRAAYRARHVAPSAKPTSFGATAAPARSSFSLRRLFAYTIREALELLRDPIRLGFSLFGTALLMLVFGFGVSTDVNNLSFAVLDHDQSPESRAYLEELRGSSLFRREAAARRLCRARQSPQERRHQGGHRNSARLRPRHQARTSRLGRRLGGRRNAVPRGDHPRLSARHASACI